MFSRTERAGEISGDVKVAAQQASANIEIVANAAEELSLSIDAIGQSAVDSYESFDEDYGGCSVH